MKVLATDYDETLAHGGVISDQTISALQRYRALGNRVIIVTGRILEDFFRVCPYHSFIDTIVAENGAHLYEVSTQKSKLLCEIPFEDGLQELSSMGITDIDLGRVIVSFSSQYYRDLKKWMMSHDYPLQIILNRDSLMILPQGVDKLTGLLHALRQIRYPISEVIGFGDAENDIPFLIHCGESVAVQNAIHSVKRIASYVTRAEAGDGVVEFLNSHFF